MALDPHGNAFHGTAEQFHGDHASARRSLRSGKADQYSAVARRKRSSVLKQRHRFEPRLHGGVGVAVRNCEIAWCKTPGLGEGLQRGLMFIDRPLKECRPLPQ